LLRATPLARSLAREHGVDLARIEGSGSDGAILGRDVLGLTRPQDAKAAPDTHLHWWRRGTGIPVVLIHGFGADQGSWRPLAQQHPAHLCVAAVDLPNHGKSASRSVRSLQEIAALVLQRLDEEGIDACHVVGHSLGGAVSLAMAQEAPRRVKSLTLLAPAGLGQAINATFIDGLVQAEDEAALKATMSLLFHDASLLTGSFLATALQQLQRPGRRDALAGMAQQFMPKGVQGEMLLEALEGVRVPTRVLWGANDRIIPASHAQGVPGRVALHLLPEVGHLPQLEASALVAELVEQQVRAGS
jgi:pyruvate dehydrogenase E2 component (dihydrolipoamide acetyltransferase)